MLLLVLLMQIVWLLLLHLFPTLSQLLLFQILPLVLLFQLLLNKVEPGLASRQWCRK